MGAVMGATAPLLDAPIDRVLFQRPGGGVTAAMFLAHARGVAVVLPGAGVVVLLCRDRYLFAVAFAAAVMAGRTALLNVEAAPGQAVVDDGLVEGALPVAGGAVPDIRCDQVAAIVFTSGSTGAPTPHPKRWGSLVQRSRAAGAAFGFSGGSVVGTVPPQHMYGFELTVLLPLHAPVCSWCGPAFFPGDVAAALLASAAPRQLVTTPLQLRALLQGEMRLPLAGVVSATAPLEHGLAAQAEAAWGCPVREVFGATECGSIASRQTTAGPDWAAYPGVSIDFDDDGAVVTAAQMAPVRLADVLERVAGGFRLLGRRTDLVKLGGRRASLTGLNRALLGIDGVEDGAFVVPDDLDERSTARLVAVVVAPGRSGAAILAALRGLVDPVFLPRRVVHVERLPRNELGKLPRLALLDVVAQAGAA
jgi:acyl-coenzyme A synthetase/AMP-(fatty) acid ligase